ncbi:unnamed protein product [Echinostoma caproni]|uniref:DUF3719 domain-containing protein n=1 Tax=Echinostoma caproni TaxID=27848 RepID=A0A183A5I0_9TREM|nr:unnamed protein product [Echinostoma caproni]
MGMSPGQDPPKFHLISVPIVQCKPPAFHVLSSDLTSRIAAREQAGTLTRLLQPGSVNNSRLSEEQNCHASYPTIPQECIESTHALLTAQDHAEFRAKYFNTIPLKSNTQRKFIDPSVMHYGDQQAAYSTSHEPTSMTNGIVDSTAPIAPCPLVSADQTLLLNHNSGYPNYLSGAHSFSVESRQQSAPLTQPFTLDTGSKSEVDSGTGQSLSHSEPHWMEQYLNELYSRKQWLTQALFEAEISLKRLLCEESEFSQNAVNDTTPNSGQPQLRRATVGIEPPGLQAELNGSITVVRGNEERTDATVPRRLLRWWRQNKRRSVVDSKRRQSMGFMSMHCPDPANGLPPMELRTRGSSMPPNESRTNGTTDGNQYAGRSSNRASLRLHQTPANGYHSEQAPMNYHSLADQSNIRPAFTSVANATPHPIQPPVYQYVPIFPPNCISGPNGADMIEKSILPCSQRIHFFPCQQVTTTNTSSNNNANPAKADTHMAASTALGFAPYINQGDGSVHACPSVVESGLGSLNPHNLTPAIGKGPPSRWTTVRCRPLCSTTLAERCTSPPPLPPRVTMAGARIDPVHAAVLTNMRHQMQHSRVPQGTEWTRSGLAMLSNGSTVLTGRRGDQRIARREMSNPNGPILTTVQAAPHFEPIHSRQMAGKQSKRWNASQVTFTPIPKSHPNADFNSRARFPSVGNPTTSSRIINGYEICPQTAAFAPRRVQSANVRTPAWGDQLVHPSESTRNPFVEPLWQLRLGGQLQKDHPMFTVGPSNGTGKTGRTVVPQTIDHSCNCLPEWRSECGMDDAKDNPKYLGRYVWITSAV